ncbi:hypothetical protein H0H92_005329 [Tricholoma furcatifolium]|nr:hypothetical protein H0H92_005329 [Tricholoma furcatifolium]
MPPSHTPSCQKWFITAVCVCIVTTGPMHFFVMLRLWLLSRRDRRLVVATLGAFVITELAIVACAIAVCIEITREHLSRTRTVSSV